jgi:hypothetical protein
MSLAIAATVHDDLLRDTACAIGAELGIGSEEAEALRHAAALHNIGMIAIPSTMVDKPGPLTRRRVAAGPPRPLIAERILTGAPALASSARLVRWTLERTDGTGYPDGLSGEQIPIAARIISVAATFRPGGTAGAGTDAQPGGRDFVTPTNTSRSQVVHDPILIGEASGSAAPGSRLAPCRSDQVRGTRPRWHSRQRRQRPHDQVHGHRRERILGHGV